MKTKRINVNPHHQHHQIIMLLSTPRAVSPPKHVIYEFTTNLRLDKHLNRTYYIGVPNVASASSTIEAELGSQGRAGTGVQWKSRERTHFQ